MLNPNNDRLDYSQVIAPPDGYRLDFAVGTTYSLDLDALVGACIALSLSEETDSDLLKNPICLLEALRATGDKVALFCEGGQIHLPNNVTSLYILLEKMVFPVTTSSKRRNAAYPSFHPKFWLIRYINKTGDVFYRVAVLSRNLTFDRSWDVCFCMDGKKEYEITEQNKPVSDFVSYLINQLPKSKNIGIKKNKMRSIAKELSYVEFTLDSKEFDDFEFVPVGISKEYNSEQAPLYDMLENTFHEAMIISPFLSKSVIKDFNERSKKIKNSELTLITRSSELSKLKPEDCSNIDIYTLKDAVVDGETMISEEDSDIKKQDIHAKIYMLKKYSESCLYLGSLNASHNALFGNIEFMIKLYSRNRYLNLSVLKNNLFGEEEECPFQHAYLQNDEREIEDETNKALDRVIKEINRLNSKAIIKKNDNLYDITLSFPRFESEFSVTVSPLLSNKTAELSETILFEGMSLTQLSEFYKISVSNGDKTVRRVITIPTDNMPDEREKAVVSGIVNDKGSFNRYIAFLLGDNIVLSALETNEAFGEGSAKADVTTRSQSDTLPSLYEKMLRTATTDPERFREIEYLLNTVDNDGVIPDGFRELYNTFKKVVKF